MSKSIRILALALLLAALAVSLCACGEHKANVEIVSADFAESIPTGGVTYTFEEYDIYKIVLNASLAEKFDGGGAKGDDFRDAMYDHIRDGCALTVEGGESNLTWGYWPEKATAYSATQMTLFYTVTKGTPASAITFTVDGAALGDGEYQFTYTPQA